MTVRAVPETHPARRRACAAWYCGEWEGCSHGMSFTNQGCAELIKFHADEDVQRVMHNDDPPLFLRESDHLRVCENKAEERNEGRGKPKQKAKEGKGKSNADVGAQKRLAEHDAKEITALRLHPRD